MTSFLTFLSLHARIYATLISGTTLLLLSTVGVVGECSAQVLERPVAPLEMPHSAQSSENMVATVNPIATQAGIDALEKGGNAIDAAIAAALTLGVVDGYNSGIGGGCFILVRTADGKAFAIDGREKAPSAAHRDMYLRNGVADPTLSQIGPLAMGVPGALAAFHEANRDFGNLSFASLLLPAADVADNGFPVSEAYYSRLKSERDSILRFSETARILLRSDGTPFEPGEVIRQPDLARTYRMIAEKGCSWFYNGPFATQTEAWCARHGGIITARDFANYSTVRRTPIRTTYRNYEILGFPPPSSGGIHVAQILNILQNFQLKADTEADLADSMHIVAEAMKLAFADRAFWLGDPDYVNVPRGLIDTEYAKELAGKISTSEVTPVLSHGTPPNAKEEFFQKHTTHIAAADRAGNWVAITSTVNTSFGSKVIVPGLGVVMNNQMDDFSIAPGVPNAYGLVGAESNAVASGKRPLSSMSPTIIFKDGQPIMTMGAAGGPTIITQVVCAIVYHLDFGKPIDEALAAARVHHQWSPDKLLIESDMRADVAEALIRKGHKVEQSKGIGISQAITYDSETKRFHGVADPRTRGGAGGTLSRDAKKKR